MITGDVTPSYAHTECRVLKISELTRLVTSQLVLIGAKENTVNLACVC